MSSRSRSPHFRSSNNRTPTNDLSLSPNTQKKQALWRQRRQMAETPDYEERKLSPARLSPYRNLSPARSRNLSNDPNYDANSWANEEDNDQLDVELDRYNRALEGLEAYKSQFKKFTPEIMDKENNDPEAQNNSVSSHRAGKNSVSPKRSNQKHGNHHAHHQNRRPNLQNNPNDNQGIDLHLLNQNKKFKKAVAIEDNPDVLIRRQKDIDYGKNQEVYAEYLRNVEKEDRTDLQPWTPDKYEKMTRRNWDKQVKIWRKQLHYWREPKPIQELLTPGTSPCTTPNRRRSPPRFLNPNITTETTENLKKPLFGDTIPADAMDDDAMTGFPTENVPFVSSSAINNMKTEALIDDNSNSCMSVTDDPGVPAAFRK